MKIALVVAVLFATGMCWAAPGDSHIDAPRWSVDYSTHFDGFDANGYAGETAVTLQGESLFWASNARTVSSSFGAYPLLKPGGAFEFTPAFGFAISGFSISYDITFATAPVIADGNQYALQGYQLTPGTVIAGTGLFAASTGATDSFTYLHTTAVLTDYLASGASFSFQSTLTPFSSEFDDCTFLAPGIYCQIFGTREVRASLSLNSVTITPTVSPIPEPQTFVLMLGGLILVVRRCGATRARQTETRS